MKHLDLFSGIGGFAYAVDQVWPGAEHIFCEIDSFCQAVLKKHWPEAIIHGDIRKLTANAISERFQKSTDKQKLERKGSDKLEIKQSRIMGKIDLLTGGFPCQPFSQAGKRKGKNDDRFLWPEMLRIIREFRPTWIIGENVSGIVSMAQRQGEFDLESETDNENNEDNEITSDGILCEILDAIELLGYSVQAFVIPACAVNAPHRRDRIWIVAHSGREHGEGESKPGEYEVKNRPENAIELERSVQCNGAGVIGNTTGERFRTRGSNRKRRSILSIEIGENEEDQQTGNRRIGWVGQRNSHASHSGNEGLQGSKQPGTLGKGKGPSRSTSKCAWDENWIEVATRLCSLDDGLRGKLVRLSDGRKVSYAKWRVEALKAAGNSIVPQVVAEIMMAIKNETKE